MHQATQIQGLEEDKVRLQGEVFALQEVQVGLLQGTAPGECIQEVQVGLLQGPAPDGGLQKVQVGLLSK